jgi:hypothetical protein
MTPTIARRLVLSAFILGAALYSVLAGAQTSGQTKGQAPPDRAFYVVLDTTSKTCSVSDKEPKTDSAQITVATDAVYATRAEAQAAIPTLKPCNQ